MKSPAMPKELPPLPVGKNGKKMVYVGDHISNNGHCWHTYGAKVEWEHPDRWRQAHTGDSHYATESDSAICRANGWGDYEKPEEPATMLEVYRQAARDAVSNAQKGCSEARAAASLAMDRLKEWDAHLTQCLEVEAAMNPKPEPDHTVSRLAWFNYGKQVQKLHGRNPTRFPFMP